MVTLDEDNDDDLIEVENVANGNVLRSGEKYLLSRAATDKETRKET